MREAIPPLAPYAFMAWCSVRAQGQFYLYFCTFYSNSRKSSFAQVCCHKRK